MNFKLLAFYSAMALAVISGAACKSVEFEEACNFIIFSIKWCYATMRYQNFCQNSAEFIPK